MRIIEVSGRKLAAGLWWQSQPTAKRHKANARVKALELASADFNVIASRRSPTGFEYGLGSFPDLRRLRGVFSLGAAVANAVFASGPDYAGMFVFNDGAWVIGLANGSIIPDYDYWGPVIEANDRFNDCCQFMPDATTVVHEDEASSLAALEELLAESGPPSAKLEALFPRNRRFSVVAVVAVVVAAVVAWHMWSAHVERVASEREARMEAVSYTHLTLPTN